MKSKNFAVDKEAGASSLGRNGYIKTHGVHALVWEDEKKLVTLIPITSRSALGKSQVEMTEAAMTEMAIWWLFQRLAISTVEVPVTNFEDSHVLTVTVEYNSNGLWIKLPGQENFTVCVDLYHQQFHHNEGSSGHYPQVLLYDGNNDEPEVRAMWKTNGFEVFRGDEPQ